jgi:hypothetical protein
LTENVEDVLEHAAEGVVTHPSNLEVTGENHFGVVGGRVAKEGETRR